MKTISISILILALFALAGVMPGFANTLRAGSQNFDLSWHTIDGGGGTSSGSGFTLSGTIGQPDAGTMSGGGFELAGGFWAGAAAAPPGPACPADLNNDGDVDVLDMLMLFAAWGPVESGHPADLNGDEVVDVLDMLALFAAWGPCS